MSPTPHYDVIIAGAGPAGSACGTLLAREGLSVLLLDKSKFPRDKICGDCINPASWTYFDLLGVTEALRRLDLRIIESIRIANLGGKEIVVKAPANSARPFFAIRRSILDNLLLQNAMREGARFLEETMFLDATKEDSWNVLVRRNNGIESYRCDYLVGADGRNSTVANKIGAWSRTKSSVVSQKRIGIQWHSDFQSAIGSEVQLYTMKDGYFGIVNVDDRNSNIAMVTNPNVARKALDNFPGFIEETVFSNPIIGQYARHFEPHNEVVTTFPINPVRRYWRESKTFLAGDARQTVEPFTGEGVSFALEDGIRTARQILGSYEKRVPSFIQPRGDFWVNRVVSPVLRNHEFAESLVALFSQIPWLPRLLARTVFRSAY